MTDTIDRLVVDWLREGPERGPEAALHEALEATRRVRQRPAWAVAQPFPAGRFALLRRPQLSAAYVWVILLLLLAAAAVAIVAGSQARLPAPSGPAGNGALAWDDGNAGVVYLADPDGGNARPLIGGLGFNRNPVYSPDGTRLAFWSRPPGDQYRGQLSLFVALADGSQAHRVTGDMAVQTNPLMGPSWSPDSTEIVFSSTDGAITSLFVVPADGSSPPRRLGPDDWATRGSPSWSPDGQWIAYSREWGTPPTYAAISVIHPDGTGERDLATWRQLRGWGATNGPSWAPDSSALVYARLWDETAGTESDDAYLAIVSVEGGPERLLFAEPSQAIGWPGWSPDGAWIAFGTGDRHGTLAIVRPDGSNRTVIESGAAGEGVAECTASWSPDSKSVVSNCAGYQIVDLASPELSRRLPLPSDAPSFDWQRIAAP